MRSLILMIQFMTRYPIPLEIEFTAERFVRGMKWIPLVGLLVAQIVIVVAAPLMQVPWIFDPAINLCAFLISAVIGVVFGYFPARRAASLNPIDALRHE